MNDRSFYEREIIQKNLVDVYMDRFHKAKRGRGFHNCAGFVKYMLGLSQKDGFVKPNDSSVNGLIYFLEPINQLGLSDFNDDQWRQISPNADAVAFLHNTDGWWRYLHFIVPYPDPDRPFDVFQRGDFEAEAPDITDIRDVIQDKEFVGDTRLVFFRVK